MHYWRVTCLPDTAKLLVNGVEQTDAVLHPHDQMVVGSTMLRFDAPLPPTITAQIEQVPRLVVSYSHGYGNVSFTAALRSARITLGRGVDCGIVVPSAIVSRLHAEFIRLSEATYELRNLGSKNSLQLNGKPVTTHLFRHGDTITIGAGSGIDIVLLCYLAPVGMATTDVNIDVRELGPSLEQLYREQPDN